MFCVSYVGVGGEVRIDVSGGGRCSESYLGVCGALVEVVFYWRFIGEVDRF